jgi:hypothetical protein
MKRGRIEDDHMQRLVHESGWYELSGVSAYQPHLSRLWNELRSGEQMRPDPDRLRLQAFLWGRMLGRAEGQEQAPPDPLKGMELRRQTTKTRIEERDGRYYAVAAIEIPLTDEQLAWLKMRGELKEGGILEGLKEIDGSWDGGLLDVDLNWPRGRSCWWPMTTVFEELLPGWELDGPDTLDEAEKMLAEAAKGKASGWQCWPKDPDAYLSKLAQLMADLRAHDLKAARVSAAQLDALEYEDEPGGEPLVRQPITFLTKGEG